MGKRPLDNVPNIFGRWTTLVQLKEQLDKADDSEDIRCAREAEEGKVRLLRYDQDDSWGWYGCFCPRTVPLTKARERT